MSTKLNSSNISDIIKNATESVITQTEESVSSLNEVPLTDDTVTVTINGVETTLNKEDYDKIKSANASVHAQMKLDIKNALDEFKNNLKAEIKNNI